MEIKKSGSFKLPLEALETDPCTGLTEDQVRQRLDSGWSNRVHNTAEQTEGQIILHNCITFFNMVFVVLAVLLLLSGSTVKNLTFLVVVIINTVIGCVQQIRAKRAVDRLTLVAARQVKTLRDGRWQPVHSEDLVRDDIVSFSPGDQICADGILCDGALWVNEALISGEAKPVAKNPGDQLRSGSFVTAGSGSVRLTQVGDDAFAAQLTAQAKQDPKVAKSEMMRALDKLIRVIGIALIPIGGLLFYQEFQVLQLSLRESAEATVAALVGMIPEGLYLLTSIALAVSAMKLTKQKVLVRDMNCIETLARVDVLCVDKTGTITEPVMELEDVLPLTEDEPEYLQQILTAMYANREPDNETGKAIAQMFPGKAHWQQETYIPFTSETKWAGAAFANHGAFVVGAAGVLLADGYPDLSEQAAALSARGYRVLLLAGYDGALAAASLDSQLLRPLAFLLLRNRIRPSAKKTFAYFEKQGVQIKVISGDDPRTASDVAQTAGIRGAERYVDAQTLETEVDFLSAVESYTVFGRVTPDKKRSLIRALKQKKHTVAMTGDGVNDVLAMKEADCAVAMAGGAQAASQVAQLVLLENDFSAMPGIVGEGRRVINNIQRAAALFLVKNIFSLGLSLVSFFTAFPYPLMPLHMSIISGLTIGVPSFFLAMEPNYERVRGRFLAGVLRRAFPGGLSNIFVIVAAQAFMVVFALPLAQMSTVCTAILATVGMLVLYQVCMPFDKFRRLIWFTMLTALVLCFTILGSFLELRTGMPAVRLVMFCLLVMAPTVFFVIRKIFDWGDMVYAKLKGHKKQER